MEIAVPDKSPQKKSDSSDATETHPENLEPGLETEAPASSDSGNAVTISMDNSRASASIFAPDTILDGKYKVLSVIGQGGMGTVYRVEQIFLGKQAALKTISGEFNDNSWRRFQIEAKAASRLEHPCIVRVSDFGLIDNKQPYCVMELVEGESLADYLKRCARLPYDDIFAIFIPLCLALQEAHEMGIIHRDVKPSNIMLIGKLGNWECKLLDFGIAKVSEGDANALTQTGELIGSPLYMSPEQCGAGIVDARSDIYSLGCTLFEAITACPPFAGSTPIETISKHLNEKPPSLKEASLGRDFPPDLERIVHTMLAKNPDQRFSSAKQVAENLVRLKAGDELRLSPQIKAEKVSKLSNSSITLGLIAIAAIGLAVYFWAQTNQLKHEEMEREKERTSEREREREMVQTFASAGSNAAQNWKKEFPQTSTNEVGYGKLLEEKNHPNGSGTAGFYYQQTITVRGQKIRCFDFPRQCVGKLLDEGAGRKYFAAGRVEIPWHGPLLYYPDADVLINFPGLFDKFQPDEIRCIVFEKGKDFYYNCLSNLTHYVLLEELSFEDTDFDDSGFKYLKELPHIRSLNFFTTNITSQGLSKYSRLRKLGKLCVSELPKMSILLKALQGDSDLDVLHLRYCSLDKQDYELLAKLPKLNRLHLDLFNPVKSEVLLELSKSKTLRWVDMQHALIPPESFPALAAMQQLKVLYLTAKRYTPEQQAQIKALLPKCDVVFNP